MPYDPEPDLIGGVRTLDAIMERSFGDDKAKVALFGRPVNVPAVEWYRTAVATDGDGTRVPEVRIYGVIGGSWFFDGVSVASFAETMDGLASEPRVKVRIDSPGGSVFAGVAIYNIIRDHPANITAVVDSLAASAASFVLQAADWRVANPGAEVMVHEARVAAFGTAALMREAAGFLDLQNRKISKLYAARAGGTAEEWAETMSEGDLRMLGDEALERGLVDEVVTDRASVEDEPSTDEDSPEAPDAPAAAADEAAAAGQQAARQLNLQMVIARARLRLAETGMERQRNGRSTHAPRTP